MAVGGSVRDELLGIEHRDEDFVVPGLDHDGLGRALAPYGRVEEMVVHGELKGVRLPEPVQSIPDQLSKAAATGRDRIRELRGNTPEPPATATA